MNFLTIILAGLTMIGPLAIDTYLPSFPAIGQAFGVSDALVQQTLSFYLFTFALMMLFYGTLSDSFGRRPVILISLICYILSSFAAALAPNFTCLLLARVFQGLSAGAGSVVSRAIVRDRLSGHAAQKMLPQIMMVFGLAPAIAPVLGGWLHIVFGWRSVFIFLALFGILMFFICYSALPESLPFKARQPFKFKPIAANYWRALIHPQFIWWACAIGMAFAGIALYIGSAAHFIIKILHQSETAFAWLFIPLIIGMVTGSAVCVRFASRYHTKTLIIGGYIAMLSAAIINFTGNLFFLATLPWAVLPLTLYTFGLAIVTPSITNLLLDIFPYNRGMASSLQAFVQMLTFAIVSGALTPFLYESALGLAKGLLGALLVSFFCWNKGRRHTHTVT